MIGIPLGLLASNATEWFVHKYVLHGVGRNKKSFWAFHWHDHHRNSRRNEHIDPDYQQSVFGWHGQGKEAFALATSGIALLPLAPVAPFFVGTMIYCGLNYYRVHKRAHQDAEWARENLPWHYAHHMGPNQDANWCVTRPWFDHIMGTRELYVNTEREAQDIERNVKRQKRKAERKARRAAEADKGPAIIPALSAA